MRGVPARERVADLAKRRSATQLQQVGRELRNARIARGLGQGFVAAAAGISQPQLSRIERGVLPRVSLETVGIVALLLGFDASVRLFLSGEPIRDKAHVALLERFRMAVGETWRWAAEVPLPIPGDRRAWDRLLRGAGVVIGVEAETRPTDMQELQRRLALKKRDGQVDRVILVLADTAWCRQLLRLNDIDATFPMPGKVALRALAEGRDPRGDAAILV
jgi:transcriptional regulator with XRE-family HTH domain